jgi:hypothetical protein
MPSLYLADSTLCCPELAGGLELSPIIHLSISKLYEHSLGTLKCYQYAVLAQCDPKILTTVLFIPQIIYEYGEPQWNNIHSRKSKNSGKNTSQCHFVNHKSHMD